MNVRCEQGCVAHCRQRKVMKYTRRKWRRTAVPGAPDFCMMYRVVGRPARVTTEGGADHSGVVVLKNTGGWSSIALVVRGEVHDRVLALWQRAVERELDHEVLVGCGDAHQAEPARSQAKLGPFGALFGLLL